MSKAKGGTVRYVPVLKLKLGEMWALNRLKDSTKSKVIPLFDILPHRTKTIREHADDQAKRLSRAWGPRPFFLDTQHVGTQSASAARDHESVFRAMQSRGCEAVAVTSLTRSPQFQQAVKNAVQSTDAGILIRLSISDFSDVSQLAAALAGLVRFMTLQRSDVDIMIDYCAVDSPDIVTQLMRSHINCLPNPNDWRSLTVVAGCFPPSIKSLGGGRWHRIRRAEWAGWCAGLSGPSPLARRPFYGDYGIRDPGVPPEFGMASANLRYTVDGDYLVQIGSLLKNGGAQEMHAMCQSLIRRTEYRGPTFSAGDAAIAVTATSSDSSGGPQQWVQWCMNHHFESVVEELVQLP